MFVSRQTQTRAQVLRLHLLPMGAAPRGRIQREFGSYPHGGTYALQNKAWMDEIYYDDLDR
jgi:hypothetical protein